MQRRHFIASVVAAGSLAPTGVSAVGNAIGTTVSISGTGLLERGAAALDLAPAQLLEQGDVVKVFRDSLAELELFTRTRINLGAGASLRLDRFLADQGGTITVDGPMVFDRPDDMAPLDLTVQVAFGQIGVRGTQFFLGPSRGMQTVFVSRGSVGVRAAGVSVTLFAGQGTDLAAADLPPGPVVTWGAERIREAFLSAGVTLPA